MLTGNAAARLAPLLAALALFAGTTGAQEPLRAYTEEWPPYVRAPDEPLGGAARIVRLVVDNMDRRAEFEYFDFGYSYRMVKEGRADLSFPYFRTAAREGDVLWSEPLFSVRNRVFYNRRFHDFSRAGGDFSGLRIGRVAGYSYGDAIDAMLDDPVVFATEVEAVEALLNNSIDLLPVTDAVADAILAESFPNRRELVRAAAGVESWSTLHVIAPKTAEGHALIAAFNESRAELIAEGLIADRDLSAEGAFARAEDIGEIVVSEGFPIVVGVDPGDPSRHYAIPQGTRVLMLEWSPRIAEPSRTDRLYQAMTDQSRVVVLNGPHVGRELLVKNMHIAIVE